MLRTYFHKFPLPISEYTITNFLIWMEYYEFHIATIGENLFIISERDPSAIHIFPPLGTNWEDFLPDLRRMAKKQQKSLEFHRIPESYLPIFSTNEDPWKIIEDRNNWDYLHQVENFVPLHGKEYANLRKKLNRFKRAYQWSFKPITEDLAKDLVDMQEIWCEYRSCTDEISLDFENEGILHILNHWKNYALLGGVIYVKHIPIAFTIAEAVSPEMVVIHIEKASHEYNGAYQAIAHEFARHLDPKFRLLNREQDLGKPGLRRSKLDYKPDDFVKKYVIKKNFAD